MRRVVRVIVVVGLLSLGPALRAVAAETESSGPDVKILALGKAPRAPLRLTPSLGQTQQLTMTLRLRVRESGVSSAQVNAPPIRATIAATVQDMTPEGNLDIDYSYPSFEVLPGNGSTAAQRRAVESALAGLDGVSGQLTMSQRGLVLDSSIDVPAGIDPSAAQQLNQFGDQLRSLSVPLPQEPVGAGARWRASTILTLSGITVHQVYDYTVRKQDGGTLELGVRVTQTAKRQTITLPNQPAGSELRVTSYRATGRGTTTVDSSRPMPLTGDMQLSGDQIFRVKQRGQSGTLRQHIEVGVVVKPVV